MCAFLEGFALGFSLFWGPTEMDGQKILQVDLTRLMGEGSSCLACVCLVVALYSQSIDIVGSCVITMGLCVHF